MQTLYLKIYKIHFIRNSGCKCDTLFQILLNSVFVFVGKNNLGFIGSPVRVSPTDLAQNRGIKMGQKKLPTIYTPQNYIETQTQPSQSRSSNELDYNT